MDFLKKLSKKKVRRILTLSAASLHSGMHCVYVEITKKCWHVLHHRIIPYPQKIRPVMEQALMRPDASMALRDIALLDNEISLFTLECARSTLSAVSPLVAVPDVIIFDRLALWQGMVGAEPYNSWNLHLGEPQVLASSLNVPVFTDLIRHDILAGGTGMLPIVPGDFEIAKKAGHIAVLLNIGVIAHMSIIDSQRMAVLVDSDAGPGTFLINKAACQAGCAEGFDRDGTAGSSGTVDTAVLEHLVSHEWFRQKPPKSADLSIFDALLRDRELALLTPNDVLATITALTPRAIFNFFKQNYPLKSMPDSIWVSGGGTKNLALMEHLKAYFSPIQVKSVADLDIPAESRFPLSLALTINAYVSGQLSRQKSKGRMTVPPGKWAVP